MGDITGKRVLLSESAMKSGFGSVAWRTVDVVGGFGAGANPSGKLFVRHVEDGVSATYRGTDVEEILGDVPADEIELDYDVSHEGEGGAWVLLGTVRAASDSAAMAAAGEAAGGSGGVDFFGRLVYTEPDGVKRFATAVRSRA